ncbi:MAG: hypothetical protein HS116_05825 [Planctomycetes bacterium]|nr:hypothetical protein [Planctomycetota bacterium]
MDWLVDFAIAGIAGLLADAAIKETTGKHIHEHVFEWWCNLRDCITEWLGRNRHLRIQIVVGYVTDLIDKGIRRGKRLMDVALGVAALDEQGQVHVVEEATSIVSAEEALQMFPDLAQENHAVLANYTSGSGQSIMEQIYSYGRGDGERYLVDNRTPQSLHPTNEEHFITDGVCRRCGCSSDFIIHFTPPCRTDHLRSQTVSIPKAESQVDFPIKSGSWAHEQLYEWWRAISKFVDKWVQENSSFKTWCVIAWVSSKLDQVAVRSSNTISVLFWACSNNDQIKPMIIAEVELSAAEVAAQFPDLQSSNQVLVVEYPAI